MSSGTGLVGYSKPPAPDGRAVGPAGWKAEGFGRAGAALVEIGILWGAIVATTPSTPATWAQEANRVPGGGRGYPFAVGVGPGYGDSIARVAEHIGRGREVAPLAGVQPLTPSSDRSLARGVEAPAGDMIWHTRWHTEGVEFCI